MAGSVLAAQGRATGVLVVALLATALVVIEQRTPAGEASAWWRRLIEAGAVTVTGLALGGAGSLLALLPAAEGVRDAAWLSPGPRIGRRGTTWRAATVPALAVGPALIVGFSAIDTGGAALVIGGTALMSVMSLRGALSSSRELSREVVARIRVGADQGAWPYIHGPVGLTAARIDDARSTLADGGAPATLVDQLADVHRRCAGLEAAAAQHGRLLTTDDAADGITDAARERLARMRRWGGEERLPTWCPERLRGLFNILGDQLDLIRLLHTPRLEWVCLFSTLWLRAAIVVCAPAMTAPVLASHAPLGAEAAGVTDAAWGFAAVWAIAVAAAAPWVVPAASTGSRAVLRRLFLAEQAVALGTVAAAPGWATGTFAVGPVNWSLRPVWTLGRMASVMALNLGALGIALALWNPDAGVAGILLETGLTALVILVIGSSYGLLFPFTLYWLVSAPWRLWHDKAARERDLRDRTMRDAIACVRDAERAVRATADLEPALRESALADLRRASGALAAEDIRGKPGRDTLEALVSDALFSVLDPVTLDRRGDEVRARVPTFRPNGLRSLRLDGRAARGLRRVVRLCAIEAARRGEGTLRTRCRLSGDWVEIAMANEPTATPTRGHGTGLTLIADAVDELDGGEMVERGLASGEDWGLPDGGTLFVVRLRFSAPGRRLRQPTPRGSRHGWRGMLPS